MAVPTRFRPYILVSLFLSFLLGVVLLASALPTRAAAPSGDASSLSISQGTQQTVLSNGLTVLTKEIHTAPVVSVQVWYRVGSRNETPGENGISHQLEHLMFKGTVDRPIQFGRLFSALGSDFNAFTSYDETAYYNTVESDKLEALLALEADRMEKAAIGAEQLDSERRVVISELQGYGNSSSYRLNQLVMRSAFPNRAYGLPPGGTIADVQKFTVEQVQNHYKTYYTPNNATLVITGDFSTQSALQEVRKYFEKLPKRSGSVSPAAKPAAGGTSAGGASGTGAATATSAAKPPIVLREPGSAALLQVVYPLPDALHPDVPAIDLMDMILTGGRSSRLYQALVEKGFASSVGAAPVELIEPGWYSISAVAAPGKDIEEIDRLLQQSLADLRQRPVSPEELTRAKTQLKTSFVLSSQDVSSQASQLAYDQTVTGDYRYGDRYLEAVDRVTPADIQRAAQTYLDPAKRTVGFFEPTIPTGQGDNTSPSGASRTTENFKPGKPVDPAEVARYLPPITATARTTPQPLPGAFTLNNGLRVLLLPDSSTPMVSLNGWVEAGLSFDTNDKAGLASLTADNLMNGTRSKNALALATTLEDEGASLSFSAAREGVNIGGNALSENLPTLIQTLADVLQNATFPVDQLELSRQQSLAGLKAQLDDPESLGWRVFRQAIYPANHPFHSFPTAESLARITQADVVNFYKTHYRSDTTLLSLVGNFNSEQMRSLLNQAFGSWKAEGARPVLTIPPVSLPQATTRLSRVIPGKTEAVTYLGYSGIARKDPRYYAATVLNQILGGDTLSSRLGTEVRDRQGLTYGIYSFFQTGINPGPFAIEMQTSPADTAKAIDSTLAVLKQFREQGITEAELEAAKRSITSSYPVGLANPDSLSTAILANDIYGLGADELRQFPKQINAVTLEQVQQVTRDLIHPDKLVIVTIGSGQAATNSK